MRNLNNGRQQSKSVLKIEKLCDGKFISYLHRFNLNWYFDCNFKKNMPIEKHEDQFPTFILSTIYVQYEAIYFLKYIPMNITVVCIFTIIAVMELIPPGPGRIGGHILDF